MFWSELPLLGRLDMADLPDRGFVTIGFVITGALLAPAARAPDRRAASTRQHARQPPAPADRDSARGRRGLRPARRGHPRTAAHRRDRKRARQPADPRQGQRVQALRHQSPSATQSAAVVRHITRNQILATVTPGDGTRQRHPDLRTGEPAPGATGSASTTAPTWRTPKPSPAPSPAASPSAAATNRPPPRRPSTEKELTVAKLSLLHAQVEPHFLYNTLASAQYLTRSDPARADEMLGHLIQYLRHSLPRTDDALSTLGDELERARAYLEILQDPHGPAPVPADRRARGAARHAVAADDAADAGRERDQARPGTASPAAAPCGSCARRIDDDVSRSPWPTTATASTPKAAAPASA